MRVTLQHTGVTLAGSGTSSPCTRFEAAQVSSPADWFGTVNCGDNSTSGTRRLGSTEAVHGECYDTCKRAGMK